MSLDDDSNEMGRYTVAPGDMKANGDIVSRLANTLRRMELENKVSRADVEPYIDHFPVTVGLEDFDEVPSDRNLAIATESMAAFLKIGLAVAVVGAVGYVIYNLIMSRKKCDKITEDDARAAVLFKEINKVRGAILNTPAGLNDSMVGSGGLNLKNAIARLLSENANLTIELETEGSRLFSRIHYGDLPEFGSRSCMDQYAEILSQEKAIAAVRDLLKSSSVRIQNGQAGEVIAELEAITKANSVSRFIEATQATFAQQLPRSANGEPGQTEGNHLLAIVDGLEAYYETIGSSSVNVSSHIVNNLQTLGQGTSAYPASERKLSGDIQRSISAVRSASSECEKLKNDSRGFKLTQSVEEAASAVLDNINAITKAASRLFDITAMETNSAYRHARWLAGVHVKILEIAEDILKTNSENASASNMASARKDLEKLIKKTI